jgi:hypothetical protein
MVSHVKPSSFELQSLMATCEYDVQRDSIPHNQIFIVVADNTAREKLLFDPQLTLAKAIVILRACETSSWITKQMKGRCSAFCKQCSKCDKFNHRNSENVASIEEYVINSLSVNSTHSGVLTCSFLVIRCISK